MSASPNITTLQRWRTSGIVLLMLGVGVAWAFRQVGMSRAIDTLNAAEPPGALTAAIDFTLYGIASGCIIAATGFVIFLVAVIRIYRRNRTNSVHA